MGVDVSGLKSQLEELTDLARKLGVTKLKAEGLEIEWNHKLSSSPPEDVSFESKIPYKTPELPKYLQTMPSDDEMRLWSTGEDFQEEKEEQPPMIGGEP